MNNQEKPLNPYLVMAVAILLPGCGQVLNRQPERGFRFLFFILLLGWITYHLTTPAHTMVGRLAGGIFIYSLAVLDAYKWARVRWERHRHGLDTPPAGRSAG